MTRNRQNTSMFNHKVQLAKEVVSVLQEIPTPSSTIIGLGYSVFQMTRFVFRVIRHFFSFILLIYLFIILFGARTESL